MPHCIIECSKDLELTLGGSVLADSVYRGALRSDLFQAQDIKTRCIPFNHYKTGSEKENFIHVTVKILSGRSLEQRRQLSQSIVFELKQLELPSGSLTVEVVEIEAQSYSKVVL